LFPPEVQRDEDLGEHLKPASANTAVHQWPVLGVHRWVPIDLSRIRAQLVSEL
jgi:hypothetical protein